jgi:carbamoyl-phosphate synthase large subunit
VPLAKIAAKIAMGKTLKELGVREVTPKHIAVKEAVFPFVKFPGVDTLLGPEMRSTGEVMGIDRSFDAAFAKSQIAAGTRLPIPQRDGGKPLTAFLSVQDSDKAGAVKVAQGLRDLGFRILATSGTYNHIAAAGIEAELVGKVREGRPNCVDRMLDGEVQMVINTTQGRDAIKDSFSIRRTALTRGLPYFTTLSGARAAVGAIAHLKAGRTTVCSLQEYQSG